MTKLSLVDARIGDMIGERPAAFVDGVNRRWHVLQCVMRSDKQVQEWRAGASRRVPEAEQRDQGEVLAELLEEASGILNWLIAGCLDYLEHGLVLSDEVRAATQEAIEEMDPIGQFARAHITVDAGGEGVQARKAFAAYRWWCEQTAKRVRSETKFGRDMRKMFKRDDSGQRHVYLDVKLSKVPDDLTPWMPRGQGAREGDSQPKSPSGAPPAQAPPQSRDDDLEF